MQNLASYDNYGSVFPNNPTKSDLRSSYFYWSGFCFWSHKVRIAINHLLSGDIFFGPVKV